MKINVVYIGGSRLIKVRRDLRYLLTPESLNWLTEKTGDDYDYSDQERELRDFE